MTSPTPSPTPLGDRLRAHFADRTAREPLPGPTTESALGDALSSGSGGPDIGTVHRLHGTRPSSAWFAAAAAVLAVGATAAAIIVLRDDPGVTTRDGGTDPGPTVTVGPPVTTGTSALPPPPAKTLVIGFYGPLGGWDGDSWVDSEHWQGLGIDDGSSYQVVRVGEAITTQVSTMDQACGDEFSDDAILAPHVDLPWTIDAPALSAVAVTGVANPVPRPVAVLDPGDPAYRSAAGGVLTQLGVTDDDPEIVEAVQADLDGDGTTEVIVVAERNEGLNLNAAAGDYSVAFLLDGTVVINNVVTEDNGYGERYRIDAVADLNGDTRMEIITHSYYEEGHSQEVAELSPDHTIHQVLADSCKA